jgi:hypothetical protein
MQAPTFLTASHIDLEVNLTQIASKQAPSLIDELLTVPAAA